MQSTDWIGIGPRAKQCRDFLDALRIAPVSTLQAREQLGIASPAARVLDLRKQGHAIATHRAKAFDAQGRTHTVAVYLLEVE